MHNPERQVARVAMDANGVRIARPMRLARCADRIRARAVFLYGTEHAPFPTSFFLGRKGAHIIPYKWMFHT